MKKRGLLLFLFLGITFVVLRSNLIVPSERETETSAAQAAVKEIQGTVEKGETLSAIFEKYGLNMQELFMMREASANVHRLRNLRPEREYTFVLDKDNQINAFTYWLDDDVYLSITREEESFLAKKNPVEYERRTEHFGGAIRENLVESLGQDGHNLLLALQLSDIFAWDIDFTTDLRRGDTYKIVVEGLYRDGIFRKFGNILSAEFNNDGKLHRAFRFGSDGKEDYYDEDGTSLKKAFLKAPLNFRRISSGFSKGRYHPVLKIYRPHHGLDYAAPAGTPVSALGDGVVHFSGYRGQYGNLVVVRHANGWKTYYGHLRKIAKGVRRGAKVDQGQTIGYVGSTGLATGPHLHYELRVNNRPVNPKSVTMPAGRPIDKSHMPEFRQYCSQMEVRLASIPSEPQALTADNGGSSRINAKTRL